MIPFANRHKGLIDARWREYLPALTRMSRELPCPTETLEVWKITFHRRLRILFDAGVRWLTIRKLHMDDPIAVESSFLEALGSFRLRSAKAKPRTGSHDHYRKDFEKRYAKEHA